MMENMFDKLSYQKVFYGKKGDHGMKLSIAVISNLTYHEY